MIQPNELRIGNYVKYLGEIQQVVGIDSEHVYLDTISFDYIEHDEVEPLEISEETLSLIGVKKTIKNKDSGYMQFGVQYYCFDISIEINQIPTVYLNNKLVIKTFNIHHIQNLFFAISGEEINK